MPTDLSTDDIPTWAYLDELVDTDPIALRDVAFGLTRRLREVLALVDGKQGPSKWQVSPPSPTKNRPSDCYDILDSDTMDGVLVNLPFALAEAIVTVHNAALDEDTAAQLLAMFAPPSNSRVDAAARLRAALAVDEPKVGDVYRNKVGSQLTVIDVPEQAIGSDIFLASNGDRLFPRQYLVTARSLQDSGYTLERRQH